MLTTIFIDQLQLFAPIGWYEEERVSKVGLTVSVKVKFKSSVLNDELNKTMDYGMLTSWILEIGQQPAKLLETLAENILLHIEKEVPRGLVSIWVGVRKSQIQSKGVLAIAHGVEVEQSYPKSADN